MNSSRDKGIDPSNYLARHDRYPHSSVITGSFWPSRCVSLFKDSIMIVGTRLDEVGDEGNE